MTITVLFVMHQWRLYSCYTTCVCYNRVNHSYARALDVKSSRKGPDWAGLLAEKTSLYHSNSMAQGIATKELIIQTGLLLFIPDRGQ